MTPETLHKLRVERVAASRGEPERALFDCTYIERHVEDAGGGAQHRQIQIRAVGVNRA